MPFSASSPLTGGNDPVFREGEERFRAVFTCSSDALFITDTVGAQFLDVNPRACQILGYSRRELLSLSPSRIISSAEARLEWNATPERTQRDAFCRQKSGLQIHGHISMSPVKLERKPCILVCFRTSTQRQLAQSLRNASVFAKFLNAVATGAGQAPTIEHAIRFSLHQLCDFRCWPVGHSRIFAKRFITFHVPADTWYFVMNPGQATRIRPGDSRQNVDFNEWYARITTTARPFVVEDLVGESDRKTRELARSLALKSALVTPLLVGDEVVGTLEFFSCQTITLDTLLTEMMSGLGARLGPIMEQKRSDARVEGLSTRLFRVQDEERRRLAVELHDTTAQHLAAILMDLNVISRHTEAMDTGARTALSECISLARQSLYEVRTFSYLLHPPMLDELGLISALRIYLEGFSERSGMRVNFEPPESYTKLPSPLEVTLFHVVQEGLTNAHRHSGSSWATVRITLNTTEVTVNVENETTGDFSIKKDLGLSAKTGVGMRSVQERVEHFGGRSALHADPYRTTLEAVLPLRQAAQAAGA